MCPWGENFKILGLDLAIYSLSGNLMEKTLKFLDDLKPFVFINNFYQKRSIVFQCFWL